MTWTIHHINVPSSNVRRDARFFRDCLGLTDGTWIYPPDAGDLHHDDDGIAYFGTDNCGLHVVRLIPEFAAEQGFLHNPTVGGHVALNVKDVGPFIIRCKNQALPLSDAGTYAMAGVHQTYAFDPAGNLIEVNSTGQALPDRNRDPESDVAITGIILPAHELEQSARFYGETVGLGAPSVSETAANNHVTFRQGGQSVHLARVDPDFPGGHNPTFTGCFRIAVESLDTIAKCLDDAGLAYSDIGQDRFTGRRALYTFTPSARLVALEQSAS